MVEVIKEVAMDGYILETQVHEDDDMFGAGPFEMEAAYTPDGHYIGNAKDAHYLCAERGIKPELITAEHIVCSIGFCEKEQKWYGWSHRAIYGFGIGSEIKKGDCGYIAKTPEGLIEDHVDFHGDISKERADQARNECQILDGGSGIRVLPAPLVIPVAESGNDLVNFVENEDAADLPLDDIAPDYYIVECGKGEWSAETLDDARQMAIDFANGVS